MAATLSILSSSTTRISLKGVRLVPRMVPAQRQDAAEIVLAHLLVFTGDEAVVAVQDAHDLDVLAEPCIQGFGHAADGGVQAGTVAAGGQDTNTFFHIEQPSFLPFSLRGGRWMIL